MRLIKWGACMGKVPVYLRTTRRRLSITTVSLTRGLAVMPRMHERGWFTFMPPDEDFRKTKRKQKHNSEGWLDSKDRNSSSSWERSFTKGVLSTKTWRLQSSATRVLPSWAPARPTTVLGSCGHPEQTGRQILR